jgi:hypothetical protein
MTTKQIYIIECQKHGVCKIGVSDDPAKRLKSIQTGYPWPLSIRTIIESANAFAEESTIHRTYQRWRLEGEWFDICVAVDIEKRSAVAPVELPTLCKVHRDESGEFYCHLSFIDQLFLFSDEEPSPLPPAGCRSWWLWVAKEVSFFAIGERGCYGTAQDILSQCFTQVPAYIEAELKKIKARAINKLWHCSVVEYKKEIEDLSDWVTAPRDYYSIDSGAVAVPDQLTELSPWCQRYLTSFPPGEYFRSLPTARKAIHG